MSRTSARLWLAAAVSLAPIGLVGHEATSLSPGTLITGGVLISPGYCNDAGYCTPGIYSSPAYYPGTSQLAPGVDRIRLCLLLAGLALLVCATQVRTLAILRVGQVGTAALVVATCLSASLHAVATLSCGLVALALVAPLVARRTGRVERASSTSR